jgi:bacterioferritin-associated ferredoxin
LIVCSCHAVTDREIRKLAREGACTSREIARSCGAGSSCGGCRPHVKAILAEVRSEASAAEPLLVVSATEAA